MKSDSRSVAFDLDTSVARKVYSNRRGGRYISGALGIVFLALTVYGVVRLPGAIADSAQVAVFLFGLILIAIFTFITISGALMPGGRPPTVLTLSEVGVELRYPSLPRIVQVTWSARGFLIVLRDFRGHPTPVSDIVQVERIGRAPFWLQPPTAPLTPAAFDALLSKSREKGLSVTQKRGGTVFNTWPNTEITIRQCCVTNC